MSEKASTIVINVDQTSQWGLIVPGKEQELGVGILHVV
jgi:hypothetical protein